MSWIPFLAVVLLDVVVLGSCPADLGVRTQELAYLYYGSEANQYSIYYSHKALLPLHYRVFPSGVKVLYGLLMDRITNMST